MKTLKPIYTAAEIRFKLLKFAWARHAPPWARRRALNWSRTTRQGLKCIRARRAPRWAQGRAPFWMPSTTSSKNLLQGHDAHQQGTRTCPRPLSSENYNLLSPNQLQIESGNTQPISLRQYNKPIKAPI